MLAFHFINSLRYRAGFVSLVKSLREDVRSIYVKLRERYLLFIFAFPGIRGVKQGSLVLSKLTRISFRILPAVPVDQFVEIMT
jgi:hypothetical protein